MSLIEVKGLKKSFGALDVLKGIDLTVEKGERIAIIGGSGCGKSVFLRSLTMLDKTCIIHRLTGDPPLKTLVAPQWAADKKRLLSRVNLILP